MYCSTVSCIGPGYRLATTMPLTSSSRRTDDRQASPRRLEGEHEHRDGGEDTEIGDAPANWFPVRAVVVIIGSPQAGRPRRAWAAHCRTFVDTFRRPAVARLPPRSRVVGPSSATVVNFRHPDHGSPRPSYCCSTAVRRWGNGPTGAGHRRRRRCAPPPASTCPNLLDGSCVMSCREGRDAARIGMHHRRRRSCSREWSVHQGIVVHRLCTRGDLVHLGANRRSAASQKRSTRPALLGGLDQVSARGSSSYSGNRGTSAPGATSSTPTPVEADNSRRSRMHSWATSRWRRCRAPDSSP